MKIFSHRFYRLLCSLSLDARCFSRSLLPMLVGLCLGVTISMMYAPFSEDSCETYLANQDPQKMVKLRETKSLEASDESLYEPRQLSPDESFMNSVKLDTKSKFYRPKFAATELGIRQKLLVAVLTSRETLNTLAVAVNKTVAHYVTKTVFFIDKNATKVPSGMFIVNFLDGYNHLMPLKVFKFLIEKYGHDYDYYMFLSDRAYIRAEKLFDLVSHISVTSHVHMGTPTGVEGGKAFCSLDGGITISQSMLSRVNSTLKWCLDNCHHSDQNLNFGKCLLHASDLACQTVAASKVYNAYPVKDFNFDKDIEALKEQTEFNNSVSVFPMPDDVSHYKLHRYFCEVELNSTRHHIGEMKRNILYMSQFAPGGTESVSWPIGVPEQYKPKNRFDVIRWDYFTETHIYFKDDFTNVRELTGADKLDVQDIIKIAMERLNEMHHNKYLFSYLINGYRRFDPQRGMEYILDLALDDTSIAQDQNGESNHNDRIVDKRFYLVRPLGEVEVVPMPYVSETTRIHLVLPVTPSDVDGWGIFLESYSRLQKEAGDSLALIMVYLYPERPKSGDYDIFSVLKSMVAYYNDQVEDGVKTSSVDFFTNGTFIPEHQIIDVVSEMLPDDALILTCTIGMQLSTDMLNRVRINTVLRWQVFFPIGFWQFKPNLIYDKKPYPSEIEFNSKAGHYDALSFEHGSFYNLDYKEAKRTLMIGELHECDVYEIFVRYGRLHVFRAVEPEFKHFYLQLDCPLNSPSTLYSKCLERRSQSLATRSVLAKRIFQYQAKHSAQPREL